MRHFYFELRNIKILTVLAALLIGQSLFSQSPVTDYWTTSVTATSSSYTEDGTTYNWGVGTDLFLDSIEIGGEAYAFFGEPDTIILRRVDNAQTNGERCRMFAERTTGSGTILAPTYPSSPNTCFIEEILASPVLNRGVLDMFLNSGFEANNIERVDFIGDYTAPLAAGLLDDAGVLSIEKNGNNTTYCAAIIALDANGDPSAYGPYTAVNGGTDYGEPNAAISFSFLQPDELVPTYSNVEQYQNTTEQIGISFISFTDLGLSLGQTFYGVSFFGPDLTNTTNLVDYASFPTNTGTNDGADFHGGTGQIYLNFDSLPTLPPAGMPASLCYVVADGGDDLYYVDRVTGSASFVGDLGVGSVEGIGFAQTADTLFAANAGDFGMVDITTGAYTSIGGFGTGTGSAGSIAFSDVDGLTYDAFDGIMYGSVRVGGNDVLIQINTSTGAHIPGAFGGDDYVVLTGIGVLGDVDDIAIDPQSGVMYAISNNGGTGDELISIDKTTGVGSVVGLVGTDDMEGFGFSNDGNIYGVTGGGGSPANSFWSIDITSGAATLIANLPTTGSDYESCDCMVEVFVVPVIAENDVDTTLQDAPVVVDVLANDFGGIDPANSNNTGVLQPSNGTVSINTTTGEITYTPDPGFTGVDDFEYVVCDTMNVMCDTAQVSVLVLPDNDGDGIDDVTDLDDDNDGVPDTEECNYTYNNVSILIDSNNVTFIDANPGIDDGIGDVAIYGNATTFQGMDVDLHLIVEDNSSPADLTIEIQGFNQTPTEYFPIILNGTNSNGLAKFRIEFYEAGTNTLVDIPVVMTFIDIDNTSIGEAVEFDRADVATYTLSDTSNISAAFYATSLFGDAGEYLRFETSGVGNFEDESQWTVVDMLTRNNLSFNVKKRAGITGYIFNANALSSPDVPVIVNDVPCGIDTDGDGLPDYLDLDSDNDGIYDAVEAGHNQPTTNGVVNGPVGLDGIPDAAQDPGNEDNGIINYAQLNSDTDSLPNRVDLDSDNDLCSDANEAYVNPNADAGDNGYYGTGNPPATNADGSVTAASYNSPNTAFTDSTNSLACTNFSATDDADTTPEDTPVTVDVLANDDPDQTTLDPGSVTVVTGSGPSNGSTSVSPITGEITYTPNPNFNGTDVFQYSVCDDQLNPPICDTATVVIIVDPVNDPPVAVDDADTTPEDTPVTVDVTDNDTDLDGNIDPTSVTVTTPPSNGSVSVNPTTGEITYTPDPNFNGTDVFSYQVCDDGTPLPAQCDIAEVTITVDPVNDPPVAVDDADSTPEDTPVTVDVTDNDTDLDGNIDPTSVTVTTPPSNGSVSVNPTTGEITYTPDPNFNGTDVFSYQVCDDGTPLPAQCDIAEVTITVDPVNDPPVAVDDADSTPEDTPVTVDVTDNDTDLDGNIDPTSVTVTTPPSNGSVSVNPTTGEITYTPDPNFNGTDVFSYQVCDDGTPLPAQCDIAEVTITVDPVNDPPVAVDDADSTPEDTPVTVDVTDNDTDLDGNIDPTSVTVTTPPSNGSVSVNPVTGEITYTPDPNFNGTDVFSYQVCDDGTPLPAQCDIAEVTITVDPVNDPPVAMDDADTTPEDTPVTVDVTDNDTDLDGNIDPTSVAEITPPTNGSISIDPVTGEITYTPDPDFNGTDVFTYVVCDDGTPLPAQCDTAEVTITVDPVNDPPVAVDDNDTTPEDTPVTVDVTDNDTDLDGNIDPTSVAEITPPTNGSISIDPVTGEITYTPDPDFNGTDVFEYVVCDDGTPLPAQCDTAEVTITVDSVNDLPVAMDDADTTPEDTPVTVDVTDNDTDLDGNIDPTSVAEITPPTNGSISVDPVTGEITYTPDPNFNGTDVFSYQVCDDGTPLPAQCDIAEVTITVDPVNDPPVAMDDADTTPEDTPVTVDVTDNDTDLDGNIDPTSVAEITPPMNGSIAIDPVTGDITYTPDPGFSGTDVFEYVVCDDGTPLPAQCDTAEVTISVNSINDAPIAVDDADTTPEDTPVTVDVTDNDTDIDGNIDPTTVAEITPPSNGSISIDPVTGEITYTPDPDFNGTDVFTYVVCDDGTPLPAQCDTAEVTITVDPVNDPPMAMDDADTTPEETPVTVDVTDNDTDLDGNINPTSVAEITPPTNGSISIDPVTGEITYTPDPDFNGTDVFTYVVCDDGTPLPAQCDTAEVTITVDPVNDPPVAVDDADSTPEDTPVTVDVTDNDTDFDGNIDPTTVAEITPPSNGSISIDPVSGEITYTPDPDFNGTDVFEYVVCDDGTPLPAQCDTAEVTITVDPVNDPPVAVDNAETTDEDVPVTIDVTANDTDLDGNIDPTSVAEVDPPSNGTVSVDPVTGEITYSPDLDFNGMDTFTYVVCDDGTPLPAQCDTAEVIITLNPIQDCGTVTIEVLLEGAYDNGSLTTILNEYHLLPGQDPAQSANLGSQFLGVAGVVGHPYNVAPFNHTGTEGLLYGDTVPSAIPYPATVTDWVLVSLRETNNMPADEVWKCAGLLHSDGTVEFPASCPCLTVTNGTDYHVVVEHRNHLPVMSTVVQAANLDVAFDFTNNQSWLFGTGSPSEAAQKLIGNDFVMYAGNGNQTSGRTDINSADNARWILETGDIFRYEYGDHTLNADANSIDRSLWIPNNGFFNLIQF